MRSRSLAWTFLLASCGTGPGTGSDRIAITFDPCAPVAVVVGPEVTAEEEASVASALDMWNDVAGTRLVLGEVPGAPQVPIQFEDAAAAFHGIYEDEVGVIYINRQLTDDHARAVTVAHELGHAFGLLHVPQDERASVMNPANLVVEPTSGDEVALAQLWGECGARVGP